MKYKYIVIYLKKNHHSVRWGNTSKVPYSQFSYLIILSWIMKQLLKKQNLKKISIPYCGMTYFPASLASIHQSRRTMSRPFNSWAVTMLSPCFVTVRAAYFFFLSNNMDLKTPSMSISSNLYNLLTSFLTCHANRNILSSWGNPVPFLTG